MVISCYLMHPHNMMREWVVEVPIANCVQIDTQIGICSSVMRERFLANGPNVIFATLVHLEHWWCKLHILLYIYVLVCSAATAIWWNIYLFLTVINFRCTCASETSIQILSFFNSNSLTLDRSISNCYEFVMLWNGDDDLELISSTSAHCSKSGEFQMNIMNKYIFWYEIPIRFHCVVRVHSALCSKHIPNKLKRTYN